MPSRCLVSMLAAVWIAGLHAPAWAQSEPGSTDRPEVTTSSTGVGGRLSLVGEALRSPTLEDEGWRLYHLAFMALAGDRPSEARTLLRRLRLELPAHPAAERAERLLERLGAGPSVERVASGEDAPPPRLSWGRDVGPTSLARAEFVTFMTLAGLAVGGEICAIAACGDVREVVAPVLVGGGLALGLSLWASVDGITPGQSNALSSGIRWGSVFGLLSGLLAEGDNNLGRYLGAGLIVGQVVGVGVGQLVWNQTHASSGDFSAAGSVGLYSLALAGFVFGAAAESPRAAEVAGTLLAAGGLGLIAGAFVADALPMSRARALLVDLGATLGVVAAGGTVLLIQGQDTMRVPFFVASSAGLVAGAALTFYLTRDLDLPEVPVSVGVAPQPGGAMLVLGGQL